MNEKRKMTTEERWLMVTLGLVLLVFMYVDGMSPLG